MFLDDSYFHVERFESCFIQHSSTAKRHLPPKNTRLDDCGTFCFFLFCYRLHRFLQRRTLRQMIEGRGKKKKQKKTAECARRREADPPIRGGRFKGTLSTRPSGRNSGTTPKKIDVEGKDSPPGFINVNRVRITKALKKKRTKISDFFF